MRDSEKCNISPSTDLSDIQQSIWVNDPLGPEKIQHHWWFWHGFWNLAQWELVKHCIHVIWMLIFTLFRLLIYYQAMRNCSMCCPAALYFILFVSSYVFWSKVSSYHVYNSRQLYMFKGWNLKFIAGKFAEYVKLFFSPIWEWVLYPSNENIFSRVKGIGNFRILNRSNLGILCQVYSYCICKLWPLRIIILSLLTL